MRQLTVFFDGSCGPKNPGGTAGFGYTVYEGATKLASASGILGTGPEFSNNYAEYASLYHSLQAVSTILAGDRAFVMVKGDSQLVINTMLHRWRAKSGLYYQAYLDATKMVSTLQRQGVRFAFSWVPREQNQEADNLSKVHLSEK